MKKLNAWYKINIGKILALTIIITFFTVTIKLIPYLNFLFSGNIAFPIIAITWYLFFSPTTKILVFLSWLLLPVAFFSVYFQLDTVANYLGDFLFLNLILMFMNYIKDFARNRNA
ncbi:MAG: hypothetical protein WD992_01180 [Candidatus Levyibacteriota bacterium]